MSQLSRPAWPTRILTLILGLSLGLSPLAGTRAWAMEDAEAEIDTADEAIKSGDYDQAISILEGVIEQVGADMTRLHEAYILLIRAHIVRANDFRSAGDPYTANLWEERGKERVRECLSTPGLRHTRPDPGEDYFERMNELFADVRNEIQGAFQVSELHPPDAMVQFDGDTLTLVPGRRYLEAVDVPVGEHQLVIEADGHATLSETISIRAGTTVIKPYRLQKNRSMLWYATRGGIGAALLVMGGIVGLSSGSDAVEPTPLPGPPDPP